MGCCSVRCLLLAVVSLQMVSTLERQIFDFLGYMWLPILLNFVHAVFTIVGFFGAYQNRRPYLIAYLVWCTLWAGWNVFVICLYMEVGSLSEDIDVLSLGTGSYTWWQTHGFGCRPIFSTNETLYGLNESSSLSSSPSQSQDLDSHSAILYRPLKPIRVEDCILEHRYVEALHAGIQIFLILLAFPLAVWLVRRLSDDDDGYGIKGSSRAGSIYSIQYSTHPTSDNGLGLGLGMGMQRTSTPDVSAVSLSRDALDDFGQPMTPRRVKRRSLTRNSGRSSRGSRRHANQQSAQARSRSSTRSTRSAARARRQASAENRLSHPHSLSHPHPPPPPPSSHPHSYRNPVNRLMSMDPGLDSSTSNDEAYRHMNNLTFHGHVNPTYAGSRPGSVTSFSTAQGGMGMTGAGSMAPLMPTFGVRNDYHARDKQREETPTPPPPPPPPHHGPDFELGPPVGPGMGLGLGLGPGGRPKSAMSAYSNYHPHRHPPYGAYGVANSLYSTAAGGGGNPGGNSNNNAGRTRAQGQAPSYGEVRREDGLNFHPNPGGGGSLLPLPMDSNSTVSSSNNYGAAPPAPVRPGSRGSMHRGRTYGGGYGMNSETVI